MDIILSSFENSNLFHEEKLFFLHEQFNMLTVSQLNRVIDIFTEIIQRNEIDKNPVMYQFNTVKYALLIYQICYKIENKNLYALITKCNILINYIEKCLNKYLLR